MSFQGCTLDKTFLSCHTLVIFLPCVYLFVHYHSWAALKTKITKIAFDSSFKMWYSMRVKGQLCFEYLFTNTTSKIAISGVSLFVSVQSSWVCIFWRALITLISFFAILFVNFGLSSSYDVSTLTYFKRSLLNFLHSINWVLYYILAWIWLTIFIRKKHQDKRKWKEEKGKQIILI